MDEEDAPSPLKTNRQKRRERKKQESVEELDQLSEVSRTVSTEGLLSDDVTTPKTKVTPSVPASRRRRRAEEKQLSATHDSSLANALRGLEEDVVNKDHLSDYSPANMPAPSQPIETVFIEGPNGFIARHREETKSNAPTVTNSSLQETNAVDIAITMQKGFRTLGNYSHGLLGGVALLHTVMILILTRNDEDRKVFYGQYTQLYLPLQSLFYFLLIFCCVSSLDRMEWKCNGVVLEVIVYVVSTILTLVAYTQQSAFFSQHYNLTSHDVESHYSISVSSTHDLQQLESWKAIVIARDMLSVAAGALACLNTHSDDLLNRLTKLQY